MQTAQHEPKPVLAVFVEPEKQIIAHRQHFRKKNKNVFTNITSVVRKDPISRIPVWGPIVSFPWRRLVGFTYSRQRLAVFNIESSRRSFAFGTRRIDLWSNLRLG